MTAESEFVGFLRGAAGHERIVPKVIDVDEQLPAIAYQRISSRPLRKHGGKANEWIRWQLTVVGADYLSARAAVSVVKDAIEAFGSSGNIYRLTWENDSDGSQGFVTENEPVRHDVIMHFCKQVAVS